MFQDKSSTLNKDPLKESSADNNMVTFSSPNRKQFIHYPSFSNTELFDITEDNQQATGSGGMGFENYKSQVRNQNSGADSKKKTIFDRYNNENNNKSDLESPLSFSNSNQFLSSGKEKSNEKVAISKTTNFGGLGGFEAYKQQQQQQQSNTTKIQSTTFPSKYDSGYSSGPSNDYDLQFDSDFDSSAKRPIRESNPSQKQVYGDGTSQGDVGYDPKSFNSQPKTVSIFNPDLKVKNDVPTLDNFKCNDSSPIAQRESVKIFDKEKPSVVTQEDILKPTTPVTIKTSSRPTTPKNLRIITNNATSSPKVQAALVEMRDSNSKNRDSFGKRSPSPYHPRSTSSVLQNSSQFNIANQQQQQEVKVRKSTNSPFGRKNTPTRTERHLLKTTNVSATPGYEKENQENEAVVAPKVFIPKNCDSDNEEDDDESTGGFLCGICLSKRSKKK